jgi:DNA-binding transcriptional LysR family regulator
LFALVAPFFRELAAFVAALQPGPYQIRIAAEELLLQHYLAPVVPSIISHRPDLQLSFRSGLEADMTHLLREGEVDLIVTTLAAEPPSGISNRLVAELNLALIVNPSAQIDSAEQLWTGGQNIIHPLVCSAPSEGIAQIFHRGLKRGGLQWPTRVIASSLALVPALVASGSGIGVCLDLPHVSARYDVRTLPLCGFDLAKVVALWRPPDTIKLQPFIRTISKAVFGKS